MTHPESRVITVDREQQVAEPAQSIPLSQDQILHAPASGFIGGPVDLKISTNIFGGLLG
jgi:hypothetical protein